MVAKFTSEREFDYYTLPLPDGFTILHPERVRIKATYKDSIDIGSLCYLRRQPPWLEMEGEAKRRVVDPTSLDLHRQDQVRDLIGQINTDFLFGGQSVSSLYNHWSGVIRFLDWCDNYGHGVVLDTTDAARAAYASYSAHLELRRDTHTLKPSSAAAAQRAARTFINDHHGRQDLHHGVRTIVNDHSTVEPTVVPDEEDTSQVLAWCEHLLMGISDLLLEQHAYPYALKVPDYLGWPDNRLWLFPADIWAASPDGIKRKRVNRAFDYECGIVRDVKTVEAELAVKNPPKKAKEICQEAVSMLHVANADPWHHSRMVRGIFASKCYLILFLADTGMNLEQALSLPWSEGLQASVEQPETIRQGWRSIKYRANNWTVHFESSVAHMPLLRLYLRLRTYLLKGRRCENLFFGLGRRSKGEPRPLSKLVCDSVFQSLHRLCPSLPKLGARAWRVAKQDAMIRKHGPAVASLALQHSQATGLRDYSNGSEVTQMLEMGAYLNSVSAVIKPDKLIKLAEIPAGRCISRGNPEPIVLGLALEQNCSTGADGCLNCKKYRVHADDTDTRKLLSLRFCIHYLQPHAASVEQYERLFGSILQRIQTLLAEIAAIDGELVKRVEGEVEQGELHPFWRMRLELLMELGY